MAYFNARWFLPELGRFSQPDTVIPEQQQGTIAWDRHAGFNNNPVRYTDPTGHNADVGIGEPESHYQTTKNDDGSTTTCLVIGGVLQEDECTTTAASKPVTSETNSPLDPITDEQVDGQNSGELTTAHKIGKGITVAIVMIFIVAPAEIALIQLSIDVLALGPAGLLLELLLVPAEVVIADFGISFLMNNYESIQNGHEAEFNWIIIPALFSMLPEPIQQSIRDAFPDFFN